MIDWTRRLSWPLPLFEGDLRLIHHDLSPDHLEFGMPSRSDAVALLARSRNRVSLETPFAVPLTLRFGHLAVIICDMWDAVHCVSATRRVAEMAPHMNRVVEVLRDRGVLVIHAPSQCMDYYTGTPQRARAQSAPHAEAPVTFDWTDRDPEREPPLPATLADDTQCSCDAPDPCCEGGPPYPWTRQIEGITIAPGDAVTDDGQEVYNLLEARAIDDVLLMGAHANRCILGRPFGIRQLVSVGKRPILCRDLTDSFHRDERGHQWGTEATVAHIEGCWCPTITSDHLVGGDSFAFKYSRADGASVYRSSDPFRQDN